MGDMLSKYPTEYFKSCRLLYCTALNRIIVLKVLSLSPNAMMADGFSSHVFVGENLSKSFTLLTPTICVTHSADGFLK